jgi:uncharacterized protein (TIGR02172 family)
MEYIASGSEADIYKDGDKAIKIFKNRFQKKDIEYEVNLQKMAFNYGLPVPEIYDIINIDNKMGIVMEYINGIPLGNIVQENNGNLEKYLIMSIEIQNAIHKIEAKDFPLMKDKHKCHITNANLINEEDKENLLSKIENTIYEDKLCHGDLHFSNLIQTSNGIKIIDWICACSGNPEADIYRTYLLYKIYAGELADIYLETYCKIMNVDKLKILSWASIIAGDRLGEYTRDETEINKLKEIINIDTSHSRL